MKKKHTIFILILPLLFIVFGCQKEIVPEAYKPTHAHDAYLHSLQEFNLANSALGRDWICNRIKEIRQ